jgi:hypothetical protein
LGFGFLLLSFCFFGLFGELGSSESLAEAHLWGRLILFRVGTTA